jgi:hypothetical protein
MRLDDLSRDVIRTAVETNREIVSGTKLRKSLSEHEEGTYTVISVFLEFSLLVRQAGQTNWREDQEFAPRVLNNLSLNFGVQAGWGEQEESAFFERMLQFFEDTKGLPLLPERPGLVEPAISSVILDLYVDAAPPKQRTRKLVKQLTKAIDRTTRKRMDAGSYLPSLRALEQRRSSDLLISNVRLYTRWQMLPRKI